MKQIIKSKEIKLIKIQIKQKTILEKKRTEWNEKLIQKADRAQAFSYLQSYNLDWNYLCNKNLLI